MLPRLSDIAAAQHGVFSRDQALRAGYSPDEIRARLRDGAWRRIRHGVYFVTAPTDSREAHLRACAAAMLVAGPTSIVTGPSACLVHGLDLVTIPTKVSVGSPHPRSAAGIDVRRMDVDATEVTEVGGIRVTTLARTAIETARVLDHAEAVVAVDAAMRRGGLRRDQLMRMLEGSRDVVRARRVVSFADPRSESVGESLARVALDVAGVPPPELQASFTGAAGRAYRVDFYWPSERTVGEFDGRVKYTGAEVVWNEKRREDEIRALGNAFVRFGIAEVRDPARLGRLVRAGFTRGRAFAA